MDEAFVQQIVAAVLKEMQAQPSGISAGSIGLDKLLVVGPSTLVPADIRESYEIFDIEDYVQYKNIQRYQKILITRLTLTELSDIAQGRDASPQACAVITGLLGGQEVCMLEHAFPHRKYAGKSSSRLYEVIENNARMIQSFGVKLLKENRQFTEPVPAKPAKYQAPKVDTPKGNACVNNDKLVTEDIARTLTAGGETKIRLAKDAIITPLAWDVFRQKGVEIVR